MPPLLALLSAFACGVGLLQNCAVLPAPPWWPLVAAALLFPCGLHVARSAVQPFAIVFVATSIVLAAGLSGFGYAALRAHWRLADALPPAWEGENIVLVGVVDDLPRASFQGHRFALAVERVETRGARVPARISLAWQGARPGSGPGDAVPPIRAGERWRLTVRLKRPHGNVNGGAFDFEAWLLQRDIRATGYVRPGDGNQRVDAFAGRPLDYVQRAREGIRAHVRAALPGAPYAPVLVALAIGDQSGIDERAWTVFNRTGTGHLISVSGLHVTVFAVLAGALAFAAARRSPALTSRIPARKIAAGAGLAAALGYVLLAGAEIPAQRTLLMLAVACLGLWIGRPGTGFIVWSWALVAVLLLDPWAVLAAGFWLSFFAVGLLIYVSTARNTDTRDRAWGARVKARLAVAARAQWAITLGLVPLSLVLFQQVSMVGPLANAIAIPVVTFAIVPLALAASALPFDVLWHLAHHGLAPLMHGLEWLAGLPGASWAQHQPPVWAALAGIVGAMLCLAPRGVPGRFFGAVAMAPLALALPPPPAPGTFRLTALDVGQGTAIVVQTHRHALLYDTGPRWTETADAGSRIVTPFLRAAGVRHLDAMVVSHRDLDHSGGAMSVLQALPVSLVLSSLEEDHEILARQHERGMHLRCQAHQRWEWDGVRFELLFPEPAHYNDRWRKSNDLSCVLRVASEDASALLAGDVEAVSEIDLVTAWPDALAADVLIVPHHGSRTSSTSSFVTAVAPRHAVFTVGYRNRFNHPRADVVARYVAQDAAIHRTDLAGALTFDMSPPGPGPPVSARAVKPRYWHARP